MKPWGSSRPSDSVSRRASVSAAIPVGGMDFIDCLKLYNDDPNTEGAS